MHEDLIIIKDAGDNYSAYCPDLPGVIATGRTPEETMESMKEAIEFHIDGLIEEGFSIDGRWEALQREKNDCVAWMKSDYKSPSSFSNRFISSRLIFSSFLRSATTARS